MKKILFVIIICSMTYSAFAQADNTRFENRKKAGYFNTTQIALLMGNFPLSEQNSGFYEAMNQFQINPSLTMTHGFMNEKVAFGVGAGFEIFDRNLFPLFIDFRRTLRDSDISPFFALKLGYSFSSFSKKHYDWLALPHEPWGVSNVWYRKDGGFMFHPEMGIKVPLTEKADLLFTVAYRYQNTKSTVKAAVGWQQKWQHHVSMNRLSFGVAMMFR